MKTKILLTLILLSFSVYSQIPTNGLVAWYPFTGNPNDLSGHNLNGTVYGPTLTFDRFGNPNSAYHFNGSSDYIEVATDTLLDLRSKFSISLWFNADSVFNDTATYRPSFISRERYLNATGFVMGYGNYSKPWVGINNAPMGPLCPPCNIELSGPDSIPMQQWTHMVGIWDFDSLYLYQNGVRISSMYGHLQGDSLLVSTFPMFIGKMFTANLNPPYTTFFKGDLDDIRIYDRVLNQTEVTSLYNEGLCYQTITVTDTLIINSHLTGFNPVTFQNSIKVYPNPAGDHITIDCGSNYNTISGYSLRIENALGQVVFSSLITQQTFNINLNTWTGPGVYFVHFVDPSGHDQQVRKIVIQ